MATRKVSRESSIMMARSCASANLRRAARVVTRHYDKALRASGITATQLPLLAAINAGFNGSIRELAEAVDLERTTITRELEVLQRRGLVSAIAGEDPRATGFELTSHGDRTLSAAYRAWQRAHDEIAGIYGNLDKLLTQIREFGRKVNSLGGE